MLTDVPPPALVETHSERRTVWSPRTVRALVVETFPARTRGRAVQVAWCESRFNHRATNSSSGAAGVFQFLPSTWRRSWNPWRRRSPYDPVANVLAALVLSKGGTNWSQWSC